MLVTILGWEKFNPRRDVKNPSWFRLNHSLLEDHEFYSFTHSEMIAWLYILSLASKKNSATVRINLEHAERVVRLSERDIHNAIDKLEKIQCVHVDVTSTSRGRNADDTSLHATRRDETLRNETNVTVPAGSKEPARELKSSSSQVWEAYREAYEGKYGVEPTRNAKVNSQIKAFVGRVPANEAPEIAKFYLTHGDYFYVKNRHPVGILVKDAEKLRTEWLSGVKSTTSEARGSEKMQGYQNQLDRIARGEL